MFNEPYEAWVRFAEVLIAAGTNTGADAHVSIMEQTTTSGIQGNSPSLSYIPTFPATLTSQHSPPCPLLSLLSIIFLSPIA
jgi:hypothetical protein